MKNEMEKIIKKYLVKRIEKKTDVDFIKNTMRLFFDEHYFRAKQKVEDKRLISALNYLWELDNIKNWEWSEFSLEQLVNLQVDEGIVNVLIENAKEEVEDNKEDY